MTEPTQLPADGAPPEVGAVYNYEGQNYAVTRVEPDRFLVLGDDAEWTDAIEFTDHVGEGESAKVSYVMALDLFVESYALGVIDEGVSAEQLPADDQPEAEPKG